ncbi:MAG: glycosyltransferase [Actinomycetota bacterium]
MTRTEELRLLLLVKGLGLGGVERIVVDLARGLAAQGVAVTVANVNPDRGRLRSPIIESGVEVVDLDGSDLIGFKAAARLARLVRSRRYDVVHVHGPLPAVLARLSTIGESSPCVVTTSHTPWSSLRAPTRLAWWLTARRDDASIAVSSAVAASLPRAAGASTHVIPHGVDPERIHAVRSRYPHADSDESAPLRAIVVAGHRDAKNYPNLLRSIRAAVDLGADFHVLAFGDGASRDAHAAMAESLGIADRIRFLPRVDDVLSQIAQSDVLIVASDFEGQPMVAAEALALGVPVISTAVGRVPEMVTPAVGRVVATRDPRALGSALAELARSPALRNELADAARSRPLGWTVDDVVERHLELYADLVDGVYRAGNRQR